MTDDDTPRIEVTVAAPADVVWRALRDPDLIRRWHGWHTGGLDDEVRVIYLDGVTEDAERHTVVLEGGDRFTLHPVPGGTVVRVTRAPRGTNPDWDAYYDDITEGWTTFLWQLRFALDRHGLADRHTLTLRGPLKRPEPPFLNLFGLEQAAGLPVGTRYRATLATGDVFEGEVYARSEHQAAFTVDALGPGLLVAGQNPPSAKQGDVVLAVLTAYGADTADINRRWTAWWATAGVPDDAS